jgi:hypothetical protein
VTIARGQAWGELGPLPDDGVLARSDSAVASIVSAARDVGEEPPPIGLLGGDLCRTVGGRGDEARLRSDTAARLVVDLLLVQLDDGRERPVVAHALVHRRLWLFGPLIAVMNGTWVGEWNVAPRAHPNDGVADVVRAELSAGDRWKARARLPLGTHVPHPGIAVSRAAEGQLDLAHRTPVWLDGVRVGAARRVTWRLEPDAVRIVV